LTVPVRPPLSSPSNIDPNAGRKMLNICIGSLLREENISSPARSSHFESTIDRDSHLQSAAVVVSGKRFLLLQEDSDRPVMMYIGQLRDNLKRSACERTAYLLEGRSTFDKVQAYIDIASSLMRV